MKKEKTITIRFKTELAYKLDQDVWFYLSDSLEVLHGRVIGFFALINEKVEKGMKDYLYQIEYFREQKDGTMKMYIGNAKAEEISIDEDKIKKEFEGLRGERLQKTIDSYKIEMGGAKAHRDQHSEVMEEIKREIKRLEGLKR